METNSKPRVRFAPSPTGELHVGNARTALFNMLFAKHYGGEFVLRIEDTDKLRTTSAYEKNTLEDLRWLGIDWDEGPDIGGPFGPYRQSERLEIYASYLDRLLKTGRVYPCYCTEEELEQDRAALIAQGRPPRYMGRCRRLTDEQRKKLEAEERKPTFRFQVEKEAIEFQDLIRGQMKFNAEDIGDFIIVRSNGIPAYNFAVIIDDHLMKISHVIRGEDHLSNTAIQIMLYRALGFGLPAFAHHALILGKDRSKLSKRHGSSAVREFRRNGILPEAFSNYLALLGSSYGEGREIMSVEEIAEEFLIEKVGKGGAVFDEEKLDWLNRMYIRRLDVRDLTERLIPFMYEIWLNPGAHGAEWLEAVVDSVQGSLTRLSDIGQEAVIFYDEHFLVSKEAASYLSTKESQQVMVALRDALLFVRSKAAEDLYSTVIDRIRKETGLKGKDLFMPIRAAVTGNLVGPELNHVFEILGRDSLLMRVERALESVKSC